ncbi:MAG: glutaminyl-peptide cyclotransferase [Acidobacteriaceae bacterium]|jgi:glutamine cyclotransferase|nr:glutaminyl-peptide cyclotransferase [Acidobacteriaceae bacterium]
MRGFRWFVWVMVCAACAGGVMLAQAPATGGVSSVPVSSYTIVHTYPHDRDAFTQGLQFLDGVLYEGTGLNGRSSLRKVDLQTGRVLQKIDLPQQYFGEGITVFGPKVFQLTWQSGVAFVYDKTTFKQLTSFQYRGEGWGLTSDGTSLFMSDGTEFLRVLDPATFAEKRRVRVMAAGSPLKNLNELEWVKGEVWANVWQTQYIARINPQTGIVIGYVDLRGLLSAREMESVDVLNGIAYDATGDRLFVTGKLWPKLFEIRLVTK